MRQSSRLPIAGDSGIPADMLERLKVDLGQKTFGELLQERDWAVQEIVRLRAEIVRLASRPLRATSLSPAGSAVAKIGDDSTAWMELRRLIRLADVCKLIGLGKTMIYQLKSEGSFPKSVRVGARAVRWRMADIIAWQGARKS
jgi:prophage regulatory protein